MDTPKYNMFYVVNTIGVRNLLLSGSAVFSRCSYLAFFTVWTNLCCSFSCFRRNKCYFVQLFAAVLANTELLFLSCSGCLLLLSWILTSWFLLVQLFAGAEELFSSFNVVHHILSLVQQGSLFNCILATVFLFYISGNDDVIPKKYTSLFLQCIIFF